MLLNYHQFPREKVIEHQRVPRLYIVYNVMQPATVSSQQKNLEVKCINIAMMPWIC